MLCINYKVKIQKDQGDKTMQEPKWQRIQVMPGHGLGENGQRITGCPAHIMLSRRAAAEGMVLLKK